MVRHKIKGIDQNKLPFKKNEDKRGSKRIRIIK